MSTTNTASQLVVDAESSMSKADRLAAFLRNEAADEEMYFKTKFIADDVGLSPKEIGALIVQLQDSIHDSQLPHPTSLSLPTSLVEGGACP